MVKDAEVVRSARYVLALQALIEKYENLARCEPDWNQAENFRRIASSLKTELHDMLKERDNADGD
jgi:hypothetical protein